MKMEQTTALEPLGLSPKLFVIQNGQVESYDLCDVQSFGRPSSSGIPDIGIDSKVVSRNHGSFLTVDSGTYYTDTASTNGTMRNGVPVQPAVRQRLNSGDILRIHGKDDPACKLDVIMIYSTDYPSQATWEQLPLDQDMDRITVGRESALVLRGSTVSREHATFYRVEDRWAVMDHNSRNGVLVGNRPIPHPVYLSPMDVICIGGYHFLFTGSILIYQSDAPTQRFAAFLDDNGKTKLWK